MTRRASPQTGFLRRHILPLLLLLAALFTALSLTLYLRNSAKKPELPEYVPQKITEIQEMPEEYEEKADLRGTLEEITYPIQLTDGSGRTVEKTAMVYLPYDYSEEAAYNTFYLMHGYGGSYQTFLGSCSSPRKFKNVLDHMIQNGDIAPTIVITPGYTEDYGEYYNTVEAIGNELVQDLIPYVESRYSTYAVSTDAAALIASRAHRAVGGFSMGGCATWYTLKNQSKYFEYYLPMSMPLYYDPNGYAADQSTASAEQIHQGLLQTNPELLPFYVFSASGGDDFMSEATEKQAEDLCAYEEFTWTDHGFDEGNITFHTWEGRGHSFKNSNVYLYNGLIRFYQ